MVAFTCVGLCEQYVSVYSVWYDCRFKIGFIVGEQLISKCEWKQSEAVSNLGILHMV